MDLQSQERCPSPYLLLPGALHCSCFFSPCLGEVTMLGLDDIWGFTRGSDQERSPLCGFKEVGCYFPFTQTLNQYPQSPPRPGSRGWYRGAEPQV